MGSGFTCMPASVFGCSVNTFTPPACKYFRVERCTDAPANSIFYGPIRSVFNAVRFDENPFTCQCEKENKKA